MGQSLVKNYLHIAFSTKYRKKSITTNIETELFTIWEVFVKLDCPPIRIGGTDGQVHILCLLSKKMALMKLLEEVKSHSSKWKKTFGPELFNFYWQDGYGAFSVNPAQVDSVSIILPTNVYIINRRASRMNTGGC